MTKVYSSDIFGLHVQFLKTFQSHEGEMGIMGILLLIQLTFGPQKLGAGCQKDQPCDWNFQPPSPNLWGEGLEVELDNRQCLANYDCVIKPPLKPRGQYLGSF